MVVVFVEEVPVRHPARDQLSDGFCDTCRKKERMAGVRKGPNNQIFNSDGELHLRRKG